MTALPELEVIDGGKSTTRLDKPAAEALDGQIKETSRKLATDVHALLNLLDRAKAGRIHEVLGFPSWPEYVIDAVRIAPTDKAERRMLAPLMSGEGMSQRAIAAVLDVDQKTVGNDLRSAEENSSAVTVGLDGKDYERKRAPSRRPITKAMVSDVRMLTKSTERLSRLCEDDRFAKNRDNLARDLPELQLVIDKLQDVVNKLSAAAVEMDS